MSIAHYTVPIPESATICSDWPSLCKETRMYWGHCTVDRKYGGYVIEDKCQIVLVCTDELCAVLEEKDKEAMKITFHKPGDASISNYTVPIPESARICSDWPSLQAAAMQRPHVPIVKKYGGFVMEEGGTIVIALDDEMATSAEAHPEQLEYIAEDVAELRRTRGNSRTGSAL
ncbi:hypothetical protein Q7P37_005823 [Cladosporium fusiforme]